MKEIWDRAFLHEEMKKLDVSHAVDTLFSGVVPERVEELRSSWAGADRVRLLDVSRFLLQASYGSIQVSEKSLRLIWLTSYAAWSAVEAYNTRIVLERFNERDFDPIAWSSQPKQKKRDERFDHLLRQVEELDVAAALEDFKWPDGVPVPTEGLGIGDVTQKATFDLICMAGAFVFAHELRHALFDRGETRPNRLIDEECECDRWALALMLDDVSSYAEDTAQDVALVRAKRILGIIFAQLTILTLTPRELWDETTDHPAVRSRLRAVLDAATGPVPEWFWTTVASILTAFLRRLGALPPPTRFPATDRELAYSLCEAVRSVSA